MAGVLNHGPQIVSPRPSIETWDITGSRTAGLPSVLGVQCRDPLGHRQSACMVKFADGRVNSALARLRIRTRSR